ncbi:helix-turn-helix domain-containing protein [Natronomonas marina]|uniref:helix-turn-helix domain-containing protein n=1 Tax=Natronomonas marina TaxID=2961939 RepID=UPI0020C9F7E5|nr:helix-turn-helix domain-containing protein [Natronomonas marina]
MSNYTFESETPHQDGEILERLYHSEGLSLREIGDVLGVSEATIRRWMDRHDIERGDQLNHVGYDQPWHDEEKMREKYVEEGLSTNDLASLWGCCRKTIYKWMRRHGIEPRGFAPWEEVSDENHPARKEDIGDYRYYGPNWNEQRRKALQRDTPNNGSEPVCQRCGMCMSEHEEQHGVGLHVHHIVPLREFEDGDGDVDYEKANRLENLITVCMDCHVTWENCQPLRIQIA